MSSPALSSTDPTVTDPDHYAVVFENDSVRVLEYRDTPGVRTNPHRHPDSVMVTLSAFQRRVSSNGRTAEIELGPGQIRWVAAQEHVGENVGTTDTHVIFVELKGAPGIEASSGDAPLGPS